MEVKKDFFLFYPFFSPDEGIFLHLLNTPGALLPADSAKLLGDLLEKANGQFDDIKRPWTWLDVPFDNTLIHTVYYRWLSMPGRFALKYGPPEWSFAYIVFEIPEDFGGRYDGLQNALEKICQMIVGMPAEASCQKVKTRRPGDGRLHLELA